MNKDVHEEMTSKEIKRNEVRESEEKKGRRNRTFSLGMGSNPHMH